MALAVVAAACGGSSADAPGTSGVTATTAAIATTTDGGGGAEPAVAAPPDRRVAGVELTIADGWDATVIGTGVKPILALDRAGNPGIAYLLEDLSGFVAYADQAGGWEEERVADGYFYGPIGLAYGSNGEPLVAYHDHQDQAFDQALGDLTVATRGTDGWSIEAIPDDGHDGWDSTLAIGDDGIVRAAGIDPEQFGRTTGVEYFELGPGGWEVTEIGSGPVPYEFNVGLAVTSGGEPAISYFDAADQNLRYAERVDGTWLLADAATDGDVGRYSAVALDGDDVPHLTSYRTESATGGSVVYTTRAADGSWESEVVAELTQVIPGFEGARRITDVNVDGDGAVHVVYSDESGVWHARREAGGWESTQIVSAGTGRLGQLVSFEIDDDGVLHLAIFEVVRGNPLVGTVVYLAG